jgi:hypothetical protein
VLERSARSCFPIRRDLVQEITSTSYHPPRTRIKAGRRIVVVSTLECTQRSVSRRILLSGIDHAASKGERVQHRREACRRESWHKPEAPMHLLPSDQSYTQSSKIGPGIAPQICDSITVDPLMSSSYRYRNASSVPAATEQLQPRRDVRFHLRICSRWRGTSDGFRSCRRQVS